jgi:hypothetical protein
LDQLIRIADYPACAGDANHVRRSYAADLDGLNGLMRRVIEFAQSGQTLPLAYN